MALNKKIHECVVIYLIILIILIVLKKNEKHNFRFECGHFKMFICMNPCDTLYDCKQ